MDLGVSLGERISLAGTSRERRSGLLKRDSISEGEGLWINPCEAIHTFGMKVDIDALFLSRSETVARVCSSIAPWRIAVCWRAASVLELPAGTLLRLGVKPGNRIEFRKTN